MEKQNKTNEDQCTPSNCMFPQWIWLVQWCQENTRTQNAKQTLVRWAARGAYASERK